MNADKRGSRITDHGSTDQRLLSGLAVLAAAVVLAGGLAIFAPAQMPPGGYSPSGGGGAGGGSGTVDTGSAGELAKYSGANTVVGQSTLNVQSNGQLYVQGAAANDAMLFASTSAANGQGIWGRASASGGEALVGEATNAGAFPFTVRAPSGQTADLTRWLVDGSPVASVDAAGVGDFTGLSIAGSSVRSGSGKTLIAEIIASNQATIDFTSVFSSTHDLYEVEFFGVRPATDDVEMYARFESAGSFQGTAYNGLIQSIAFNAIGCNNTSLTTLVQVAGCTTSLLGIDNGSTSSANGLFTVFTPSGTTALHFISGRSLWSGGGGSDQLIRGDYDSVWNSTAAVTGIRFLMSSGNISAGTFRVWGIPKL